MSGVTVRTFFAENQEPIIKIIERNFRAGSSHTGGEVAQAHEEYIQKSLNSDLKDITREYLNRDRSTFLMAFIGDELVGCVGIQPASVGDPDWFQFAQKEYEEGRLKVNPVDVAELRRMHVHPDYRRRGISKALLAAYHQFCKQHGYQGVHLSTLKEFMEATALYTSNGFSKVRETAVLPELVIVDFFLTY